MNRTVAPKLRILGALGALVLGAAPAFAQDDAPNDAPVVVIVESASDAIRADAVRRALRQAGVAAMSLTDERAGGVPDVLTVVVRADGRSATAQLRTTERLEVRFLRTRSPDARGRWLAAPLAGLVRAARATRAQHHNSEVLDPWSTEPRVLELTEVVDPWAGHPPARLIATALARVPASDVLDPWRNQPQRVQSPRASNVAASDIVDPWSNERGERLDRPRPHP